MRNLRFRQSVALVLGLAMTLAIAAGYGCARAPQRRGGDIGGPGGANLGRPGLAGVELGQQISALVAGLGDLGAPGGPGAANRPDTAGGAGPRDVGVSTLVLGNLAFIGIDMATVRGGGAGLSAGGGTTGSAPRGGVTPGGVTPGGAPPPGGVTGGAGLTGDGRLADGTTGGAVGLAGTGTEDQIRQRVRDAFPQIDEVFVTADPDLVHPIALVAADIQSGVSTAGRLEEIYAVTRSMVLVRKGSTGDTGGAER